MVDKNQAKKTISVDEYGIKDAKVKYQLSSEELHEETIKKGLGREVSSGALEVNTGEFTGRSPKDRFIVKDDVTRDKVWCGEYKYSFSSKNV